MAGGYYDEEEGDDDRIRGIFANIYGKRVSRLTFGISKLLQSPSPDAQTAANTAQNTGTVRNILPNRRKSTNNMSNEAQPAVREQTRKKSGGIFKKQDTPPPYLIEG